MTYSYLFFNDYSEGMHPQILEAFSQANFKQELGYGLDAFSKKAESIIKEKIKNPQAFVHFVSSGTQANTVLLASSLKSYESIISAETGHIAVHETGALEATGHKVVITPVKEGKLTPKAIQKVLIDHHDEHMVHPRIVYLSQSTELGTIYSLKELQKIYKLCQKENLYLYIDGARLGHALTSKAADFDLQDIANYSDAFSIGGTKNGALLGEAIVIVNVQLQEKFRYYLKQHGALLAKGRALGIPFIEFFNENLYFENAKHANQMAQKLATGIKSQGYHFASPPVTNQIFVIFPDQLIKKLQKKYGFYVWSKATSPKNSIVRFVTSWATEEKAVQMLLDDMKKNTHDE
ncbi:MAG: threonine aldolase family protein [Chthoniobacterales bacterium]